jgi:phosphoribosylglycinamide formyltransferase-1
MPDRIMNSHPSLLPKYGGKGFWGIHVHEAVLAAHEKESGPTVHLVSEEIDSGRILSQVKVPVLEGDTPEVLAGRVLEQEHGLYWKTIRDYAASLGLH